MGAHKTNPTYIQLQNGEKHPYTEEEQKKRRWQRKLAKYKEKKARRIINETALGTALRAAMSMPDVEWNKIIEAYKKLVPDTRDAEQEEGSGFEIEDEDLEVEYGDI